MDGSNHKVCDQEREVSILKIVIQITFSFKDGVLYEKHVPTDMNVSSRWRIVDQLSFIFRPNRRRMNTVSTSTETYLFRFVATSSL